MENEEKYLEKIYYYEQMKKDYCSKLIDDINDFECDYDFVQDYCSIYYNKKWFLKGLMVIDIYRYSLKEWFDEYHDILVSKFNLKLIKVKMRHTLIDEYKFFKLYYTFKDNVQYEEISNDELKEFMEE